MRIYSNLLQTVENSPHDPQKIEKNLEILAPIGRQEIARVGPNSEKSASKKCREIPAFIDVLLHRNASKKAKILKLFFFKKLTCQKQKIELS